jgi:hypothetical protein
VVRCRDVHMEAETYGDTSDAVPSTPKKRPLCSASTRAKVRDNGALLEARVARSVRHAVRRRAADLRRPPPDTDTLEHA